MQGISGEEAFQEQKIDRESSSKHRALTGGWRLIVIIFGVIVMFLAVNTLFDLRFFVGYHLFEHSLYYLVLGPLFALSFLVYPPKRGIKGTWAARLFWVDVGLFLLVLGISMYFAWHGMEMITKGWVYMAPFAAMIMAVIAWFLLLESIRRIYGTILAGILFVVSIYPLFAAYMPGLLEGVGQSFYRTAQFHMLGTQSAIGLLLRTYIEIVLGFIVFGVAVAATGGGKFFLDLALSLVGRTRGGTAKVAILASALFGSINGQPIVNVLTTGSVTIPAMKAAGFEPHTAGAVETCASTAGTFTPPIMGITAFVMASFLQTSYAVIALAAAVPAALFFFGLYIQVDGYAVKHGLLGLTKEEMPSFLRTLKYGWFYLPAVGVLIYLLFFERMTGQSAFIATGVMLVLAQIRKESRFTWSAFLQFLEDAARTLVDLIVVMAGVGMLIGVFSLTGIGVTFAREFLNLAGGNLGYLLILAAVASLIMGMGMTMIACYIFLAIVMAPALVMAGVDPLSAHLFIMYVGMLSYITPPIAMCAFAAASIAKTSAMKIGLTAVRLGGAIYLLPFFFALDPALILRGETSAIALAIVSTSLGIFVISSALEGYMVGLGKLWSGVRGNAYQIAGYPIHSYVLRGILIAGGILLGLPWLPTKGVGLAIIAATLLPTVLVKIRRNRKGL